MSDEVSVAPPSPAAAPTRPAGVPSPCLMVYPIPSIADETFLHTVFKHRVGRSLFAGFGKGRFAVLELTDKPMLNKIVKLLKERDAQVRRLSEAAAAEDAEAHASGEPAEGESAVQDAVARDGASVKADKVENWLETVQADELTFASLFASPGATSPRSDDNAKKEGGEADVFSMANKSVDYLLNMSWRGLYPIFVGISPVTIEEMHACGGVVPEKKAVASAAAHPSRKPKRQDVDDGATATTATTATTSDATAAAVPKFPKDCCQKCGSRAHFTRKCDGSSPGPSSTAATVDADAAPRAEEAPITLVAQHKRPRDEATPRPPLPGARPHAHAAAGAAPAPATAKAFPKDCCQKCGSRANFTRKCDGSGPSPSDAASSNHHQSNREKITAAAAAAAAAPEAAVSAKKPRQEAAPAEGRPSAPARPAFVRTSKDQCKHCGADSHLSRHCPNK